MDHKIYDKLAIGLILFIAIFHIYGIDFPLIDRHSWRQSITLTIAQNFARHGYHFAKPLYDICGNVSPEVFASEFPLYNNLIAFFYNNFGWKLGFARGINLIVTHIGFYYFYLLVSRIINKQAAFYALLFSISSVIIVFARKVMPDTFSLSLAIMGVYYLYRYLDKKKYTYLLLGFLLASLGVLCKLPSVMIFLFLIFPLLDGALFSRHKINLIIFSSLSIVPGLVWYFIWLPHIETHYTCMPLMYPVSLSDGLLNYFTSFDEIFMRFVKAFFWLGPLLLYLMGVIQSIRNKENNFIIFFLLNFIIFVAFIAKTGTVFQAHDYYVIPVIPMMSLFIGYLFSTTYFNKRMFILIALLYMTYPLSKMYEEMHDTHKTHYVRISTILDDLGVDARAKIIVNGQSFNPMLMSHTGRHGWNVNNEDLTQYGWISDYMDDGMEYIVVDRHAYQPLLKHNVVYQDDDFVVYKPIRE